LSAQVRHGFRRARLHGEGPYGRIRLLNWAQAISLRGLLSD